MNNKDLKKRIVEIAYKHKLGHLGSFFSSVDIIDRIFRVKQPEDIFILSSGHAALAQYVVLEKYDGINAEELFLRHGGHPHYNENDKIYCSTGSLGMGITVAVGRALSNKNGHVYVLISDGECAEGCIWEALRFIHDHKIENIHVYVNINGYAAYDEIDADYLTVRLVSFLPQIAICKTSVETFPFLKGLNAHYKIMSEEDYKQALEMLV